MTKLFLTLWIALFLLGNSLKGQSDFSSEHAKTVWNIQPSFKYDVFCLLNTLTGDPFYLKHYQKVYDSLQPKFTKQVKQSLQKLRKYKDEKGLILSASLCSWFKDIPDSTLTYLIGQLKNDGKAKQLINNEYNYYLFGKMQKEVVDILQFLNNIHYEEYYKLSTLPGIYQRIDSLKAALKKFNVVPQIEKVVGKPLKSDTVTFYVVAYARPHGINLSHNAFLSDISYNLKASVRVAIHEMLHPYFNNDSFGIKNEIATLQKDSFILNAFLNHDKSFGYNDFDGFIYEAIVRFLEQVISEHFGLITDRKEHWKTEDKGMHVFAAILYSKTISKSSPGKYKGNFRQFLFEVIGNVQAEGGKNIYDALYQ